MDLKLFDQLEERLQNPRGQQALCADVLLPIHVQGLYTYVIPFEMAPAAKVGMRVLVPVGKKKVYTGVIARLYPYAEASPQVREGLRPALEFLEDYPLLSAPQLELLQWMAEYYMCHPGEVLKAALPAGLKLDSDLIIELVGEPDLEAEGLSDAEYLILEALVSQGALTLTEAADILQLADPKPKLRTMEEKGLLLLRPVVADKYAPKTIRCLIPAEPFQNDAGMAEAFEQVKRAPQQERVLLAVAEAFFQRRLAVEAELRKRLGVTPAVIAQMVKRGLLCVVEVPTERLTGETFRPKTVNVEYTPGQVAALENLRLHFAQQPLRPALLHGVTGSGKTHIYIELIRQCLAEGKQALYLLPEISLTKQIIDRVKSAFGDAVGVYHSRYSDNERVEIWRDVLFGKHRVVVGARSALFLPFDRLGLIVVNEEHDGSFKQSEPAPRYHARDAALWYGGRFGVPVVLGSATPSVETYHNALAGKYRLVEMPHRAQGTEVPETVLVDMRQQVRLRTSHGEFSDVLLGEIRQTLERNQQVIVFKNRRGYAPYLACLNCGHVPHCVHCDISLTYHKAQNYLRCHYCGYTDTLTGRCTVCGHTEMARKGLGTERLEEQLQEIFQRVTVERMDQDTTRGKTAFARLIDRVESGEIQILVGTQMVTKGLDFDRVTLVAVTDADRLLNWPDFRAYESAYQLLKQFSGRAGRAGHPSKVIIQTYQPDHQLFQLLQRPYRDFYEFELALREGPLYPPFCRLIQLEMRHRQRDFLEAEARRYADILRPQFGANLLGPEFPQVARIRNEYRMYMMVKILRNQSPAKVKAALRAGTEQYYREAPKKTLRIIANVDPR